MDRLVELVTSIITIDRKKNNYPEKHDPFTAMRVQASPALMYLSMLTNMDKIVVKKKNNLIDHQLLLLNSSAYMNLCDTVYINFTSNELNEINWF